MDCWGSAGCDGAVTLRGLFLCAALFAGGAAHAGCGADPEPCTLADGTYHIALPDEPENAPVVLFLHGAGSSGANVVRNAGLMRRFTERGYAVLAPSALPRREGATGGVWTFYPGWEGRNELEFLRATLSDSAEKFGTDIRRTLLTGFSAGAFMVTYIACDAPDSFPAYAPLAGAFWNPLPGTCSGPVRLHQTHGWRDSTVPLEGRPLFNNRYVQGDVFAALEIWRRANLCPNMSPDDFETTGEYMRRRWTDCAEGTALELALHPGGHSIPQGWAEMVLDWFEAVVP